MKTETSSNKPAVPTLLRLEEMLTRAQDGDESALPTIRVLLDTLPNAPKVLGGDLAHEAEQALVRNITGKHITHREAIARKLEELRLELGGPSPQPLERLLVERIVICWLHAYSADHQYGIAGNFTLEYGNYLQRQQDRAQRRYLAAIKCLATVRRLALPIKLDLTVAGPAQPVANGATCGGRSTASAIRGAPRPCVN